MTFVRGVDMSVAVGASSPSVGLGGARSIVSKGRG